MKKKIEEKIASAATDTDGSFFFSYDDKYFAFNEDFMSLLVEKKEEFKIILCNL